MKTGYKKVEELVTSGQNVVCLEGDVATGKSTALRFLVEQLKKSKQANVYSNYPDTPGVLHTEKEAPSIASLDIATLSSVDTFTVIAIDETLLTVGNDTSSTLCGYHHLSYEEMQAIIDASKTNKQVVVLLTAQRLNQLPRWISNSVLLTLATERIAPSIIGLSTKPLAFDIHL